jgi:hypothetical protein
MTSTRRVNPEAKGQPMIFQPIMKMPIDNSGVHMIYEPHMQDIRNRSTSLVARLIALPEDVTESTEGDAR